MQQRQITHLDKDHRLVFQGSLCLFYDKDAEAALELVTQDYDLCFKNIFDSRRISFASFSDKYFNQRLFKTMMADYSERSLQSFCKLWNVLVKIQKRL